MLRSGITKFVLALFIFCLAGTLLFLGFSIYAYNLPSTEDYYTDTGTHVVIHHDENIPKLYMFVCSPTFIVITVCLFFYWRSRKRRDKLADDLPSYLRMYRRIRPEKVAERMKISVKELETIMAICVREGTVRGSRDPATGEFVSEDAEIRQPGAIIKCPNCGATMDNRYLRGEVIRCGYCNMLIGQQGTGKGPKNN